MITTRPILPSHLEEVLAIEIRSFPFPFNREMFDVMLGGDPFGGFVAESDGKVTGYLIYSLVVDEMQLLTIAVDVPWRQKGVGCRLVKELIGVAVENKADRIFLEVRPSNKTAQVLYGKLGFKSIGMRKKYYQDNGEDAIVMEWKGRGFL